MQIHAQLEKSQDTGPRCPTTAMFTPVAEHFTPPPFLGSVRQASLIRPVCAPIQKNSFHISPPTHVRCRVRGMGLQLIVKSISSCEHLPQILFNRNWIEMTEDVANVTGEPCCVISPRVIRQPSLTYKYM